jgi:membrane protein DedA with SNARE-associated domain
MPNEMSDFVLTFIGAAIWGDLSLISSGAMVASGEENLYLDYSACLLGINLHDFLLFFIASNYSDTIKNFAYFKKRLEYSENSIYKNYYKNYKLSKFIRYKFISKIVISLPIALGLDKENFVEYLKISGIVNFIYASSLFFIFYYLNLLILQFDIIPVIPKITGVILSLVSYIIYLFLSKIIFKENR